MQVMHFCYFMWRCERWQQWMLFEDDLLGIFFCPINSILPRSALEQTWNLHTTRGHVYLVFNETTNALVWDTCNVVPTTPWASQLSQESSIEHWKHKKKGYENSTSHHIATKHKHETNKLVWTFWWGHKSSYRPLYYFSKLPQNHTNTNLMCATKNSQYWRSSNTIWFHEKVNPRCKPSTTQHTRSKRIPVKNPFYA